MKGYIYPILIKKLYYYFSITDYRVHKIHLRHIRLRDVNDTMPRGVPTLMPGSLVTSGWQ